MIVVSSTLHARMCFLFERNSECSIPCKILLSCLNGEGACVSHVYSPELFSGAFCLGGNKSLMPCKEANNKGEWDSPIISSSGLKTLLMRALAMGFLVGSKRGGEGLGAD